MSDGPDTEADSADTEADEPVMDATHPTDEEQTEREWYLWLGALVLAGAVVLLVFPQFWPELGIGIVAAVALVWLLKTVVEWSE